MPAASLTLAQSFEVEDRIVHYVDTDAFGAFKGFVEVKNGQAFVTDTLGGSITRAVEVVDLGGTVNVAAGAYSEAVDITKNVTLLGAQAGVDPELRDLTTNLQLSQQSRPAVLPTLHFTSMPA